MTAAEISTTAVGFGTAEAEFSTSVLLMRRMTNQSRRRLFTSSPSAVCIHISEFIIADCLIFNRIEFELYGHAVWGLLISFLFNCWALYG
uniref:Putative ovule protein n=1 Tax=Solanum chacoense TaxID=4108 RepID=A0A0V0GNB3_SOLCH